MTTPEWRSEEPIAHNTLENLPGYIVPSASCHRDHFLQINMKQGGRITYRQQIIDIDHDLGLLQR